jgi:hypothetical protein
MQWSVSVAAVSASESSELLDDDGGGASWLKKNID